MTRTDSATGEDFDVKRFSAGGGSERKRHSSTSQSNEREHRPSRPTTSSGVPISGAKDHHRKQSASTITTKAHRSSGSRSSSIRSHRKGDRPRLGRMHSSPVTPMTSSSIEDAIAFHERSCRLMETFYRTRVDTEPPTPQGDHGAASPYYAFPPTPHPQSYFPTYPAGDVPDAHEIATPQQAPVEESHQSVTHWTSTTTRRKEYAEIDKRNRGLRKWMRKFMPGCLSKADKMNFYCEKDGSDAGSVRRYRLDLSDDEKD